ncbi:MAG: hypothetical protein WCX65_07735 [bacterium]
MDRLYWDVYVNYQQDFQSFIDETVSFLHIYLGDVREAIAHSDQISKFGKVIYNESAWDTDKFKEIKDDITQPNHYEVIKEVFLRIEKYKCNKIDLGFIGRWKNPYQLADTHLPTGITVSFERKEGLFTMHTVFFSPEHWFELQCKPLFRTDPIVEKESKGSWNMNSVGLIAPKAEKTAANRRAIFGLITDFAKDFGPDFSVLTKAHTYYNQKTNMAYLTDPEAAKNEQLLPLIYYFKNERGRILFSDSTEIPHEQYDTTQVKDQRVTFDKKHFDFF